MNQSFIDAIMHFISLVFLPLPDRKYDSVSKRIREYVEKAGIEIDADECLKIYNSYTEKYRNQFFLDKPDSQGFEELIHRQILADAGRNAQKNLYLRERFLIVLALLEFSELNFPGDTKISDEISRLSENLNLDLSDFSSAFQFISQTPDEINSDFLILEKSDLQDDMLEGSWIEQYNQESGRQESADIFQRIQGKLVFRYFSRFNLLVFRLEGKEKLMVNNKPVFPGYFYSLAKSDHICFEGLNPIYPDEILRHFKLAGSVPKIMLTAKDLAFCYQASENSVKPFTVTEESGRMVGIIGNNGVGKSTIIKLISGRLKPSQGNIYVNDTDLIKENYRIQSVIGFVSHDDMIFPELSIYDNLLFQARLSLGNLTEIQIKERIEEVARKFNIQSLLHIRPGDLNNRNFTEYNRKCINIAIELLRKPLILCLDEPLTGLSYSDAKSLMNLLKEEVYSGMLVIMTVHLPTLEIFRFYDKIWLIDYDGHMVFSGDPRYAYSYLNSTGLIPYHLRDKNPEDVSPEEIINIIETRKIDPEGRISNERLIKPEVWYEVYRKRLFSEPKHGSKAAKAPPVSVSGVPGIERQFIIYLLRNFRQLLNDWRSILIFLAGIPLAGIGIAVMLRNITRDPQTFAENNFLPLYIFFIVNYVLFSGMLTAADAIFKERKNVYRDFQINLSLFSYLNSKMLFVFILSFIQIVIMVLAGNSILGIKDLSITYLLTLFALSSFANLLALNLSSSVRNLSSVYLVIPFILIVCLVFSGYLVQFDDYYRYRREDKKIPLVAEMIPSRWAYEAIVVSQFVENPYNRYFFKLDFTEYQNRFNSEKLIPLLEITLNSCLNNMDNSDSVLVLERNLSLLKHEFDMLDKREEIAPYENIDFLNTDNFDHEIYESALGYITYLKFQIANSFEETVFDRTGIIQTITDSLNTIGMEEFRNGNHNHAISNLVLGRFPEGYARIQDTRILKSASPVYMFPESKYGRAAFFSSIKRFNDSYVETFRFNLSVIWILNLILYLFLITDSARIIFNLFRKNKLEKD